jgi:hypothetical protein
MLTGLLTALVLAAPAQAQKPQPKKERPQAGYVIIKELEVDLVDLLLERKERPLVPPSIVKRCVSVWEKPLKSSKSDVKRARKGTIKDIIPFVRLFTRYT